MHEQTNEGEKKSFLKEKSIYLKKTYFYVFF